jgi:fluoride exporter
MSWTNSLLVGLGGAAGSVVRYQLTLWIRDRQWTADFPLPTLLINISGSFLLGLLAATLKDRTGPAYLLLGIGFCGGYTTFSTFSLEVADAIRNDHWGLAVLYVTSSVVAGFLAFAIAVWGLKSG